MMQVAGIIIYMLIIGVTHIHSSVCLIAFLNLEIFQDDRKPLQKFFVGLIKMRF